MQKYEDQFQGFKNLYHVTGIPFLISSTIGKTVLAFPEGTETYYDSFYWLNSPSGNIKNKHPNGVTLFEVGEFCYVAVVKLDVNLFLSTVPVRTSNTIEYSFFPVLVNGIKPELQVDFYRMLLDVPTKTDFQLAEFASLAKIIYCGVPTDGINLYPYIPNKDIEEIPQTIQMLEAFEENKDGQHISMGFEKKALDAITNGDESALKDALNLPIHGNIGKMSLNELRQARYQFICMIYAATRAAIAGGITPEYAFSISDQFCQRMDGLQTPKDILKFQQSCMLKFCELVSRNKHVSHYSTYTQNVIDYVSQHLIESLSVEKISEEIGLNRKSLTQYFIKDMHQTIPEYILDKRLAQAEYLLKNSSMSLASISELLLFSSQSHFTQRFKEKYGITPRRYRN